MTPSKTVIIKYWEGSSSGHRSAFAPLYFPVLFPARVFSQAARFHELNGTIGGSAYPSFFCFLCSFGVLSLPISLFLFAYVSSMFSVQAGAIHSFKKQKAYCAWGIVYIFGTLSSASYYPSDR
jgi:hypothetical protein